MSKTVNEKAQEWNCSDSTVKRYCVSGIIPPAEKDGRRWLIPDEWPKPPMTRHGLCYLMDTIYQLNHGVAFSAIKWGYPEEEVVKGFAYLIGAAFITTFDPQNMAEELVNSSLTPRGEALIERENAESKVKTSYKAHMTTGINVGVLSAEFEAELSR